MPKDVLDEREFELINIIGADLGSNQRDLSRHLDLSLGLTNMLIRRLVTKGFIRISQLNKRKVQYVLTAKGFAEKMRKSIKYTLKTISSIDLIKNKIKDVVQDLHADGERNFVVLGKSDFALLIEIVFKELKLNDYTISYIEKLPSEKIDGALMICKEGTIGDDQLARRSVNLIYELAESNSFINHTGDRHEIKELK